MIFGKTKLELKVGIFVFAGIILLSIFVLSIGKFRSWTSGYRVIFTFNFIDGVKVGSPIRFAGVDVGVTKSIKFVFLPQEEKTQVRLEGWIRKAVKIPLDSTIWVNTLGLLGEKYVEIMPGTDYNHCLAPEQSLAGVDPIPMHEIFRMAKGVVDNLGEIMQRVNKGEGTVGKFIHDDKVYNNLEELTDNIKKNPWKLFFKTKEKK